MKYLLDTHTLLWYFEDSPKLSDAAATLIENPDARKFISVASLWEFTIKRSLEKLYFEGGIAVFWEMATANGLIVLPIGASCLSKLERLPFLHRDPFDRLLIATAIAENITILTADESIHQYDVKWVW